MKILEARPKETPATWEGKVKALSYFVGLGLIAYAVVYLILDASLLNPFSWLFAFYFFMFGMMILSAQFNFETVNNNFQFLKHNIGRGVFCFYIGTVALDIENTSDGILTTIIGYAAWASLTFIGIFHICVGLSEKK
mmetsp:Transcript_24460/g.34382  ORF Transcript_24460/g.34382 Transcript_24460/m.34382 type:complete len:137 (+) Transcript_24460:78-488(+)